MALPLDVWAWPGWSWPGWAALAAIGTAVAAIGTVAAFFVIFGQLKESRSEARDNREAAATPRLFLHPSVSVSGRDRVLNLTLHIDGNGVIYGASIRFVADRPADLDRIDLKPRESRDLGTQRAPAEVGAGSFAWKWESGWNAVQGRLELNFVNSLNEPKSLVQPGWLEDTFVLKGAPALKASPKTGGS